MSSNENERDFKKANGKNNGAALAADVLPEEGVLERISDEDSEVAEEIITALRMEVRKHFRGPLPPPEMLAEYEKIQPGLADRIVKMAEKQQDHRISLERSVVDTNNANSRIGLFFGGTIGIIGVAGSLILVALGHTVSGLSALILALASLIGVYLKGLHEKQQTVQKHKSGDTSNAEHEDVKGEDEESN
ncbi:MAG: DUF2335 domain-containing protein [Clostridiaceae bacterium]|jgi:uncharacterized membrane protein|nr:DUF2335 domain-containing protein [Clostridiaceae bacterium]